MSDVEGIRDLSLDPKKLIAVFESQQPKRLPVGSGRWGMCLSCVSTQCAVVDSMSNSGSAFG